MRELRIVPFASAHVSPVAQIERMCFADPWTEDGLREELDNNCARFLVAQAGDGEVAGYIGCHMILDEGYITNVAVSPAFRRCGIGRQLVRALLEQSDGLAFVTLEVRASNASAIALYTACGFKPVGTRRNFYAHPTEDALLMTVYLDQTKESEHENISD